MGTRERTAGAAAVLAAGIALAACELDRPPESPPSPEGAATGTATSTATAKDGGKALTDERSTPAPPKGTPVPPVEPEPLPAEPGSPPTGKMCGGIGGLPCPPGYVCVDDPLDECDPRQGGQDCSGVCQPQGTPGPSAPAP